MAASAIAAEGARSRAGDRPRTLLVLYAYYEADEVSKTNLAFFARHGIGSAVARDDAVRVQYVIVVNGACSVKLPSHRNVTVLRRANEGYDFGAYAHAVAHLGLETVCAYDYILCLNTSVRGPFMSPDARRGWAEVFTNRIVKDVKLVGTVINMLDVRSWHTAAFEAIVAKPPPFPHVQTMLFAVDSECMRFLASRGMFDPVASSADKRHVIVHREIMLSHLVLEKGWNIDCLVRELSGIDYRRARDESPYPKLHDVCFAGKCFGRTLHPMDIVFIKTNRDFPVDVLHSLTKAMDGVSKASARA